MMRLYSKIFITLSVLFLTSATFGNSFFSKYGLGLARHFAGAAYVGQGNAGIAATSPLALQYFNPAAVSYLSRTRFEGTFLYEKADIETANSTGKISDSGFNSIHIGIPMTKGYALSFGLVPFSILSYEFQNEQENGSYSQELYGAGGLEKGFLRFAGRIGDRFAYGVGMDVYFGRLEQSWHVRFADANFRDSNDITSTTAVGLGANLGMMLHLSKKLSVGAVFSAPAELDTKTQVDYIFREENEVTNGTVQLPFTHGYGLNFQPIPSVTLLSDVWISNWGDVTSTEALGAQTSNTFKIATGVEINPSKRVFDNFWKKLSYRLGYNIGTLPFLDSNNEEIQEQFFTAGLSIPYNNFNSWLELGVEYGTRGSLDQNIAEEKVVRFVFGISGGERWFQRPTNR